MTRIANRKPPPEHAPRPCGHCGSPEHARIDCVCWRRCEDIIAHAWANDPSGTLNVYTTALDLNDMHAIAQALREIAGI